MVEEDKALLQRTFELTEENNKMLHGIRRSQKMASIMRSLYWLIIIGISVGAFYFLQPYIDGVMNMYTSISDFGQKLNNTLR